MKRVTRQSRGLARSRGARTAMAIVLLACASVCVARPVPAAVGTASVSAAPDRIVTIEDYLRVEGVGRAVADPAGHRIVYDRRAAYRDRPDFGVEFSWAALTGGTLMLVDIGGKGQARP